jgi:hypothetical protein
MVISITRSIAEVTGRICALVEPSRMITRLGPPLASLSTVATGFLGGLADALAARRLPPAFEGVTAAFEAYVAAMTVLRQERATQDLSVESAGRVFALGFALDQLREDFADLHNRAKEFVPGAQKS